MSRYSPTVLPAPRASLADALLEGADRFLAARDRTRAHTREDEADRQRRALFAAQLEAAERANRVGARDEALRPLAERAEMRERGYVPDAERAQNEAVSAASAGAFATAGAPSIPVAVDWARAQYGDGAGGYALDRTLTPEGRQARTHAEADSDAERQHRWRLEEIDAAGKFKEQVATIYGSARTTAAGIGAGARKATATAKAAAGGNDPLADPKKRELYLQNVATNAVQAARQRLGADAAPLDVVRAAATDLAQSPVGLKAFEAGLAQRHLDAAAQQFGERPGLVRTAKLGEQAAKDSLRARLLGEPAAAPAAAPAPAPAAPPARAPLSAASKAEAAANPEYRKFLIGKGYTEADWR